MTNTAAQARPRAAASAEIEVPSAPDPSIVAAPEPASAPAADTSAALPAAQPSVDVTREALGEQAAEPVQAEPRAEADTPDRDALADQLAAQGSALRKRRKLGPARSKYRAALEVYPGHRRALYGLVQLAIQQRDGKQAVELALQLVQAEPDQASYSLLLGDAYRAADKPKEAREAWQNAARLGSALARKRLK